MNRPIECVFSALGGAVVVCGAVVWAGGWPGYMFLAGFLVALAIACTLLVQLGPGRVARMLLAFEAAFHGTPAPGNLNGGSDANKLLDKPEPAPPDPVRADVVATLVRLGARQRKAELAADQAADRGPRDLKSWLTRSIGLVARV